MSTHTTCLHTPVHLPTGSYPHTPRTGVGRRQGVDLHRRLVSNTQPPTKNKEIALFLHPVVPVRPPSVPDTDLFVEDKQGYFVPPLIRGIYPRSLGRYSSHHFPCTVSMDLRVMVGTTGVDSPLSITPVECPDDLPKCEFGRPCRSLVSTVLLTPGRSVGEGGGPGSIPFALDYLLPPGVGKMGKGVVYLLNVPRDWRSVPGSPRERWENGQRSFFLSPFLSVG